MSTFAKNATNPAYLMAKAGEITEEETPIDSITAGSFETGSGNQNWH